MCPPWLAGLVLVVVFADAAIDELGQCVGDNGFFLFSLPDFVPPNQGNTSKEEASDNVCSRSFKKE